MSTITSTSPLTLKRWMTKDMKEERTAFFYSSRGMIGAAGSGAAIVYKLDQLRDSGDRIRIPMTGLLTAVGQGDDGRLDDNEESQTHYYDDVEVHERAHAVKCPGLMSEHRASFDDIMTARRELREWVPYTVDDDIRRAAHGLPNASTGVENVNERTPSSGRVMYIGQSTGDSELSDQGDDSTLSGQTTSNALFGPTVIERAARKAVDADPLIAPIRTKDGRHVYVMTIGLYQAKALKASTLWQKFQVPLTEFKGEESAVFTGALGVWGFGYGHVVIHVDPRTPIRSGTSPYASYFWNSSDTVDASKYIESAVLFGRNALGFAQARKWRYFPYYGDAGGSNVAKRHPRFGTDAIYGVACLRRNNTAGTALQDLGRIAVHTQVQTDS